MRVIGSSLAVLSFHGREARQRNLSIRFEVADMCDLSAVPESDLDVMLATDDALPHLLAEQDLVPN